MLPQGGVVPMFNAEQPVGATLAGIRRQTCQILDIVVMDDGSTD
ncbi:glycosyltransferase [Mesorhizobium sp. M0119]